TGTTFIIDEDPLIFEAILHFYRYDRWLFPENFAKNIEQSILHEYDLTEQLCKKSQAPHVPSYVILKRLPLSDKPGSLSYTIVEPDVNAISKLFKSSHLRGKNDQILKLNYVSVINILCENGYVIETWNEEKQYVILKR
ncbi:unnamed protein product, partial [Didymodactylos carnosus]